MDSFVEEEVRGRGMKVLVGFVITSFTSSKGAKGREENGKHMGRGSGE